MNRKRSFGLYKSMNTATQRRALLRATLALPIASSAMLAACGGGAEGAPFIPTVATAPPPVAPEPTPVPVPPVKPPPPKPVDKAVRDVRVLNLQTPTSAPPADQRFANEDIKAYAQRALKDKFELLRNALMQGLPKKSSATDLCYFVAPEFYWNVNWDAIKDENEIKVFSSTCVVELQKHVRALIALFPQEAYGKLALLPGTLQVLMKQSGIEAQSAGPANKPVTDEDLPPYEALNYVLVIDNFSKSNSDGSRPITMWPKRNVSWIDFNTGGVVWKDGRDYWKVLLGKLDILVMQKSTTTATHYIEGKQFKGFDNDPLGGVPFGVDVCLDYASAYTDSEYTRMSQIEDTNFILDFLIACGMSVDPTHKYLPSVQYIVRNDGMGSGECEIYKLAGPASDTKTALTARPQNKPVPQIEVAKPGTGSVLFDSYVEVHALWQYPVARPANAQPSLLTPQPV